MELIGRTIERYTQEEGYTFITKKDGRPPEYFAFHQKGTVQIPLGRAFDIWTARQTANATIQKPEAPARKKKGGR